MSELEVRRLLIGDGAPGFPQDIFLTDSLEIPEMLAAPSMKHYH